MYFLAPSLRLIRPLKKYENKRIESVNQKPYFVVCKCVCLKYKLRRILQMYNDRLISNSFYAILFFTR